MRKGLSSVLGVRSILFAVVVAAELGCGGGSSPGSRPDGAAGAGGRAPDGATDQEADRVAGDAPASDDAAPDEGELDAAVADGTAAEDRRADAPAEARADSDAVVDGDASAPLTLDLFCSRFETLVCAWGMRCRTQTSCEGFGQYGAFHVQCAAAKAAVRAGHASFDVRQADACLASAPIDTATCGLPPTFLTQNPSSPCSTIFAGTIPLQGACYPGGLAKECATGVCAGTGCPQTCVPYVGVGAVCDETLAFCDPTVAFCEPQLPGVTTPRRCRAPGTSGASCSNAQPCAAGLACSAANDGTCLKVVGVGEPCVSTLQCSGTLACDAGKCVAISSVGGACRPSATNCPSGQTCLSTQRCGSPLGEGASCQALSDCQAGARCASLPGDAGFMLVCHFPGGVGTVCNSSPDCLPGLYCNHDLARCAALVGGDGSCANGEQCQAGLICMDNFRCLPPGTSGQPCSTQSFLSCVAGLTCAPKTSTCAPPGSLGAACTPYSLAPCGEGLFCSCPAGCTEGSPTNGPLCAKKRAVGEVCEQASSCLSGNCIGPSNPPKCANAGDIYIPGCTEPPSPR